MIGINILSIIIPTGIVLIEAVTGFAIYKAMYKHKIKKRLAEGRKSDIKPMMSPVKFIIITMLSTALIWMILLSLFNAKMNKQKREMAVYPSIAFYKDETLENSLFAGYKFGDEINGYNRFSKQYGDVKLEIYVTENTFDMFPTILIASDYTGDKENVTFCEEMKYSFYTENWGNDVDPDSLIAIDVGGYKGKFTLNHKVYYSDKVEDLINEPPDEKYGLDFRIHESGSIACAQIGLTVDSWD